MTSDTSPRTTSQPESFHEWGSKGNFIRIISRLHYDEGLFIFDLAHAPIGPGTWSKIWLADPIAQLANDDEIVVQGIEDGEIIVVQAIDDGSRGNQITLHTKEKCDVDVRREQTGNALGTDCQNVDGNNSGCGVERSGSRSSLEFNENGGGVSSGLSSCSTWPNTDYCRSMSWSSEATGSAYGPSIALPSLQTSPTVHHQTRQHGERLWQTFRLRTATFPL